MDGIYGQSHYAMLYEFLKQSLRVAAQLDPCVNR